MQFCITEAQIWLLRISSRVLRLFSHIICRFELWCRFFNNMSFSSMTSVYLKQKEQSDLESLFYLPSLQFYVTEAQIWLLCVSAEVLRLFSHIICRFKLWCRFSNNMSYSKIIVGCRLRLRFSGVMCHFQRSASF